MDIFKIQGLGQTNPPPSLLIPSPSTILYRPLTLLGHHPPKNLGGLLYLLPPPSRTKFSDQLLVFLKFLKYMYIAYTNLHREPDNSGI